MLHHPARALALALVLVATLLGVLAAPAPARAAQDNTATPTEKSATPVARYVVQENSDRQWHEVGDWPQETDIPFSLAGTLPADLANRTNYDYWLVAEPGDGLVYVDGSARVTLAHEDGTTRDVTDALTVGGTAHEVWAGADDIRAAVPGIAATDTLTLNYSARLTASAQRGYERGNESWGHLEYEPQGSAARNAASLALPLARRARTLAAQLAPQQASPRAAGLTCSPELQTVVYTYLLAVCKTDQGGQALAAPPLRCATRTASGTWTATTGPPTRARRPRAPRARTALQPSTKLTPSATTWWSLRLPQATPWWTPWT